jgi:NAD(P)H-dependent FMN reductase
MTIDRFYVTSVSPLLAVCGSLKPASGHKEPSACRELLRLALAPVTSIYPSIETLDLREAVVEVAAGYVFSVPAYWGGIGAAFKNFIETVCGPGYGGRSSPFADKPAAVLIVGSDPRVAHAAEPQIESLLDALGLLPVRSPILVGDPHELVDTARAVQELTAAAASVALALPASLALKRKAER